MQAPISTDGSNMAQDSGPGDDYTRTYGMDWKWCCSVRVSDDTLSKNAEQFSSGKSGFLRFHHDDNYVASYGSQLLL